MGGEMGGEMRKGVMGKRDMEGLTERGKWERGQRGGGRERRGKRRLDFTDGYDEVPGWKEVTVFSDSV